MVGKAFKLYAIVILFVISGCSSSFNDATTPNDAPVKYFQNDIPVCVTDYTPDGSAHAGMGTMGILNLRIDPINADAELSNMRETSLKDVLEVVDITNFLQMSPCTDCVKIQSVQMDSDSNIVISIGIKHPFDAGDPLKPITGRNRGDLHVFNVEGIVVSNLSGFGFPGISERVANFKLVNADGFTKYLDDVLAEFYVTDATIHPYVMHFDDYSQGNFNASNPMGFLSVTTPPPMGNLVMAMGCDYNYQDYVFDIESASPVDFIFVVGCTYAVASASKSTRFTPEYRIPQHNKKAASEVSVEIINNMLTSGTTFSTADIEIHVVDINHGVPVGDALNEMLADSSVSAITVEVPGVMLSPLSVDVSSPTGSGHDPSDPLVFPATITNTAGGLLGNYTGIVKVLDEYRPGLNTAPLLNGMDGIKRVDPITNPLAGLFHISEFATYQTFSIDINAEPATVTGITPDFGYVGQTIIDAVITGTNFDPACTVELEYAPGDTIPGTNLEWINASTLNADFNLTGATVGLYDVKVTNPSALPAVLQDGFEVKITTCPTAPNAAYAYTETPYSLPSGQWAYISPVVDTSSLSENCLDMDAMHDTTNRIAVNGRDALNRIGAIRPVLGTSGTDVTIYVTGVEVMSIDVGMDNRIVYVDFDDSVLIGLSGYDRYFPKRTKIAEGADIEFHVFDTATLSEIGTGFNVGQRIQAIDIDAEGTIWVFDITNEMHCFEVSGGTYVENTSRNFDMDTNGSNMQGLVFDFVINFYNEAFYILTNMTDYGHLYRVECDGAFLPTIEGNPNPLTPVWSNLVNGVCNDRADIVIDNFDSAGNIHDGEQDAQILCFANYAMQYNPNASKIGITRINAALGNKLWYLYEGGANTGYGATAVAMNGITNEIWTKDGPPYGNQRIVHFITMPPSPDQWY